MIPIPSDLDLSGKVALVTGASRGLGAAIARGLAGRGTDVDISYSRSAESANALVGEITALGRRSVAIRAQRAPP